VETIVSRRFCKNSARADGSAPVSEVGTLLIGDRSSTIVTTRRLARSRMRMYGTSTLSGSARPTRTGGAIAPPAWTRATGDGRAREG
jgi:hypothetical protein